MTDKEKAEWIGIDSNDMFGSIKRFHNKLQSIGITYRYSSDESDEFCRLEEVNRKNSEPERYYFHSFSSQYNYANDSRSQCSSNLLYK